MKQSLEMTLKEGVDAFEVAEKMNRKRNVKCYAVTCNSIRVYFNDRTLTAKKVLKMIQATTGNGKRIRNVIGIKEIDESQEAA